MERTSKNGTSFENGESKSENVERPTSFKIALLLAGILAIKKIISQKSGGGGHESHGWSSSGGGGGSSGWGRTYNDVSDLAYSAYKKD